MSNELSFDDIANAYDILAPADKRLQREGPFLQDWCADSLAILDAACGPGFHADYLIKHGPSLRRIVAFDQSPQMIELAHERYRHSHIRFATGDLENPPTGNFDRIIVIGNGINLLANRQLASLTMKTLISRLARNGKLLIHLHAPQPGQSEQVIREGRSQHGDHITITKTLIGHHDQAELDITIRNDAGEKRRVTTALLALDVQEITDMATQAGGTVNQCWADVSGAAFDGERPRRVAVEVVG